MKKKLFNVVISLIFVLFLVSCANNKDNIDSNIKIQKKEIKSKNETEVLRIALSTEPDSLDPYISAAADSHSMLKNIFDGLTKLDQNGEIHPAIAESWLISEDGLIYTFCLKKNIKFHNEEELKAKDVVYSYKRLASINNKFSDILDVKELEDYKVEIVLKKPDSSFIYRVTEAIMPENYENCEKEPIGAGAYKFISYEPTKKLKLEKFEDYYDNDKKGKIKNVEFIFMPDDNAKILALRSKDIHMFTATKDIIDQIDDEKFFKYNFPSNTTQLLAINNNKEPFNNKNVRKALNFAINRDDILKIITDGKGEKLYTIISPASLKWYNKDTENIYSYNKEKAIQLLNEAGYKNGFEMEIKVPSNYKIHVDTAQIIADQLSKVGIKVKINQVEWATWLDEIYTKKNYEATIVGLVGKADPHESLVRFCSNYPKNFSGYNNEKYDKYIEEGLLKSDIKTRKSIYDKAQMILTEDAVSVFLQDPGVYLVSDSKLKGYVQYPIHFWDLSKLFFE